MPPNADAQPVMLTPEPPRARRWRFGWARRIGGDTHVVVAAVIAQNVLRIVSSMVLTRLLAPEVFGVVAIISSVTFVLTMISDLGFQAFVVRHEHGARREFLDAIWSFRLLRGAALTLATLLCAQPVAAALQKPELGPFIAASSALFLVEGLSAMSLVTALREGQLLRLSLVELFTALVQLACSILLALAWPTAWSILVAMILAGIAKAIASYRIFPAAARRFRLDWRYNAELWLFARFITGSSIISMVLMQADKIVLSRLLSLEALGLYALASNLALAPLAFAAAYASRVLYPLYARTWREEPQRLPAIVYRARRGASLLYMAAAGALIGVAPLVLAIFYDERYSGATPYLRLLAITPFLALSSASAQEVLTASGRVQVTFRAGLAKLGWLAITAPLAYWNWGAIGIVAAVGTMEAAAMLYSWAALRRAGLFRLREEMLLLGMGSVGIAAGWGINRLGLPLLIHVQG